MEEEKRSILSFKDYALYSLKRWFLIVALVAIGIGGGALAGFLTTPVALRTYEARVGIITLLDYYMYFEEVVSTEIPTELIQIDYDQNTGIAFSEMLRSENFDIFLLSDQNLAAVERFDTDLSSRRFLQNHLRVSRRELGVDLVFEHDKDFASEDIVHLLNRYMGFIQNRALVSAPVFQEMFKAGFYPTHVVNEPRLLLDEPEDLGRFTRFIFPIAIGGVLGVFLGFLGTFIWFKADKSVKSVEELERIGFEIVDKAAEPSEISTAKIVSSSISSKTIAILSTQAENAELVGRLSKVYQENDFKVLLISNEGEQSLKQLLSGEVKPEGIKAVKASGTDLIMLEAKKAEFVKYTEGFDKVIFLLSNATSQVKIAASFSDLALFLIDLSNAKSKEYVNIERQFANDKVLCATVIVPAKSK